MGIEGKPMAQITCFVSKVHTLQKVTGVFTSVTDGGGPYSVFCVIIRLKTQNEYTDTKLMKKKEYKQSYKKIELGSGAFEKLDEDYKGLGTFLSDKHYTTIQTEQDVFDYDHEFKRELVVSEKIFNSACYHSLKGKSTNKEIEAELKIAYESGYNDLERIKLECQTGEPLEKFKDYVYNLWNITDRSD